MSKKQPYLEDLDINKIRDLVNDLIRQGLYQTLRHHAIDNVNERLDSVKQNEAPYMTPEQAWASAVVYMLIAHGYEITKKENKE